MKLRKLAEKDIPYMLEWMRDPAISGCFQRDFQSADEASVSEFILRAQSDPDNLHLACVDDADTYMGTVSLKGIDRANGHAEYATAFRACAHGTGLAKEATEALLQMAFAELGLRRVYLNVLSGNLRAIAFYEKCGFRCEGEFRQHIHVRGQYENLKWYAILSEEYYAGRH